MSDDIKQSIYVKVKELQHEVQQFKKDATNKGVGYTFASSEGVNEKIKPILEKLGLIAQLQVEFVGVVGNVVIASAALRLISLEDGSSLTFKSIGSGTDHGDKHAMKAATAASKYATIAAVFGSTSDDPEADATTDKPKPSTTAKKDTSVYGKDGAPARTKQQKELQDKALAKPVASDENCAVVISDIKAYPDRVGRQPFKVVTPEGTFQNFDRKIIDSIEKGSIVVYKVTNYGNDVIEVKGKDETEGS